MLGAAPTTVPPHEQTALLGELHRLLERFPVPGDDWHRHVGEIRACRGDFERHIERAAADPGTLALLAELIETERVVELDPDASAELTDAWDRLADLPLPEGRHPYGDEIAVTIEAMRLLLVALSRSAA